jgi:hypothetical protein
VCDVTFELELKLVKFQMKQKLVLRGGIVDARAWRVCGQKKVGIWSSAVGARREEVSRPVM